MNETAITTIDGENYTYKTLHTCARVQFEAARQAAKGSYYFDMTAMFMSYLTFEAYLNFLGEIVAPEVWEKERETFKEPVNEGKYLFLTEWLGLPANLGGRPYQTVRGLHDLRICLTHGRPDTFKLEVPHSRDTEVPLFGHGKLERLVSAEHAKRALSDTEEVIETLHKKAWPRIDRSVRVRRFIAETAFSGAAAYSSGSTRSSSR